MSTEPLLLASASMDSTIRFWYPAVQREKVNITSAHSAAVRCLALSPTATMLASGGEDCWVAISSFPDGSPLCRVALPNSVFAICWLDAHRVLVGCKEHHLCVVDVSNNGAVIATLRGHTSSVFCVAANTEYIVSGSLDNTLRVWSAVDLSLVVSTEQRSSAMGVSSVALFPDSSPSSCRGVAACGGSAMIFDIVRAAGGGTRIEINKLGSTPSTTIARVNVSPDGQTFASGAVDGRVTLWSAVGSKIREFQTHDSVRALSFSCCGRILASSDWGGTIRLTDVASGKQRAALKGHTRGVEGLAFVPATVVSVQQQKQQ